MRQDTRTAHEARLKAVTSALSATNGHRLGADERRRLHREQRRLRRVLA